MWQRPPKTLPTLGIRFYIEHPMYQKQAQRDKKKQPTSETRDKRSQLLQTCKRDHPQGLKTIIHVQFFFIRVGAWEQSRHLIVGVGCEANTGSRLWRNEIDDYARLGLARGSMDIVFVRVKESMNEGEGLGDVSVTSKVIAMPS